MSATRTSGEPGLLNGQFRLGHAGALLLVRIAHTLVLLKLEIRKVNLITRLFADGQGVSVSLRVRSRCKFLPLD